MINIDIRIGDTIMIGRFKNKKVTVKTITFDKYGLPLINGKPALTFRIYKEEPSLK